MSREPPPLMLPVRPAVEGDELLPDVDPEPDALEPVLDPVPDEAVPADPVADEPVPDEPLPDPEPMLEPLPIWAFFSTKLPPLPLVADAPAASVLPLVLDVELEPSPRCRHPVAVTAPADSVAARPLVACPPCGVLEVGACAASAPHKAMLLLSVIAHCI